MYHVLLPVDESEERATAGAATITELPQARSEVTVTVLNVFEEFDVADDSGGRIKSEQLFESYEAPESVDKATDVLNDSGIEWGFTAEHGDPAETILEVTDEKDVDAIVMCSGNRSPVGKVLFGSVTQGVLIDSDRPVIVA